MTVLGFANDVPSRQALLLGEQARCLFSMFERAEELAKLDKVEGAFGRH